VANDGTRAFSWQDDIWVADKDGGNLHRLTAVPVAHRRVGAARHVHGCWAKRH